MKKRFFLIGALVLLVTLVASAALVSAERPVARPGAQAAGTLEGPRWILVSYTGADGQTVEALPDAESTAQFDDGRVRGSAGCNNFMAPYEAKNGKLTIGMAASTMMMCAQPIMDQEAAYLANLQNANAYKVDGDTLTIKDVGADTILEFRSAGE